MISSLRFYNKPTSGKARRVWSREDLWEFCKCNILSIVTFFKPKFEQVWNLFEGLVTFHFCHQLLIFGFVNHLPMGGSAPLKFAMFISKSRISGWAGGRNTILEI